MYYNIRMKHARPGHNVAFIQAFSQKKALRKHSRGKPGKFFKDGGALYFQPESKTGNPAPLYYAVRETLTFRERINIRFLDKHLTNT